MASGAFLSRAHPLNDRFDLLGGSHAGERTPA